MAAATRTASSRKWLGVLSLAVLIGAAGCIDMERTIVLNKDLTGRAGFRMTVDLESMITSMINLQHQLKGVTDPPSAWEIAEAKAGVMAEMGADKALIDPKTFAANLPEGMTVIEAGQKMDGLKMTISAVVAFKDITKVPLISLPAPDSASGDTPMKPFSEFEIKDENGMIVIKSKIADAPATGGAAGAAKSDVMSALSGLLDPQVAGMLGPMMGAMKGLKITTRIETPLTVVETNAKRKDGNILFWELTMDGGLDKLAAMDPKDMAVNVKIKK